MNSADLRPLDQMIDVPCANCGWLWKSFAGLLNGKYIAHCSRCDGDMRHGKIEIVEGTAPPQKVPS